MRTRRSMPHAIRVGERRLRRGDRAPPNGAGHQPRPWRHREGRGRRHDRRRSGGPLGRRRRGVTWRRRRVCRAGPCGRVADRGCRRRRNGPPDGAMRQTGACNLIHANARLANHRRVGASHHRSSNRAAGRGGVVASHLRRVRCGARERGIDRGDRARGRCAEVARADGNRRPARRDRRMRGDDSRLADAGSGGIGTACAVGSTGAHGRGTPAHDDLAELVHPQHGTRERDAPQPIGQPQRGR